MVAMNKYTTFCRILLLGTIAPMVVWGERPSPIAGEAQVATVGSIVFGPNQVTAADEFVIPGDPVDQVVEENEPTASTVADLFKPMDRITLAASPGNDDKAPEDLAASYMEDSELYVSSSYHPGNRAQRYPIGFLHNPLYFEEPDLERCGNGCGCATAAVSAVQFLSNTIVLPYRMAADPPCALRRGYGDCRCNQELPCQRPFQCKLRAITAEGAMAAGFVFLLL